MRDEIQSLIKEHKIAIMEVNMLLEELSQIDESKTSYQEEVALKELKSSHSEELRMRGIFVDQLNNLL
jgi:hypothetical protein